MKQLRGYLLGDSLYTCKSIDGVYFRCSHESQLHPSSPNKPPPGGGQRPRPSSAEGCHGGRAPAAKSRWQNERTLQQRRGKKEVSSVNEPPVATITRFNYYVLAYKQSPTKRAIPLRGFLDAAQLENDAKPRTRKHQISEKL